MDARRLLSVLPLLPLLLLVSSRSSAAKEAPRAAEAQDPDCESELIRGSLHIDGSPPVFVAGTGGHIKDDSLTVEHQAGMSLFSKCAKHWEPDGIAQLELLGKSISFSVDLSRVGCGCNLAFYLISSPAKDWSGKPSRGYSRGGQPPYYCDANQVGGQWCPEIDIMEANTHAFQATAHKCDDPTNGQYTYCDRGGCAKNTRERRGAYGPGGNYTIDTRLPFEVRTDFPEENGILTGMRTTLSQHGHEVVLDHTDCEGERYLARLSDAMAAGMSLRITYWGDDAEAMAWMDSPPCGPQSCTGTNAGHAVISDIALAPHAGQQSATRGSRLERPDRRPQAAREGRAQEIESESESEPQGRHPEHRPQAAHASGALSHSVAEQHKQKELSKWVSDDAAPWECHWQPPTPTWCETAGLQQGYEYKYNGGLNSPCGGCSCCKRRAVLVEADDHTTPVTTSTPPTTTTAPQLVWVVTEPGDPLFAQVLPNWIAREPSLFKVLGHRAVADWQGATHFLRHLPAAEAEALRAGCGDSAGGEPCEASLRKVAAGFSGLLQRKSALLPTPLSRLLGGPAAARAAWLLLAAAMAALVSAAALLVARRTRKEWSSGAFCAGTCASAPAAPVPGAGGAAAGAVGPAGQREPGSPQKGEAPGSAGLCGASSPYRRSRSTSSLAFLPQAPGLRRAGSSCQRLLALQEAVA